MLSRGDSRKNGGRVSGNVTLLRDLETLTKALNGDRTMSRLASSTASSRAKSAAKPHVQESKSKSDDKKSSIWSWKGLKALTHVRNRRFSCCFSLQVHSISGLPALFDDVCLVVHWKRRDGDQMTKPVRVCEGIAEFEEQLTHSCSVYGSRSGPHHSAKYEAKHSLLYVSVYDAPELDLGKHRIDLTRLLPITLEELDEEKSSGKWTTSFKLSGKARSATINVSFGYVIENNDVEILGSQKTSARTEQLPGPSDRMNEPNIYRAGSLPVRLSASKQSIEDIKDLHEVLPMPSSKLRDSVNILYQKFDEMSNSSTENKIEADSLSSPINPHRVRLSAYPDAVEKNCETECDISDFSVIDKGMEVLTKENVTPEDEMPMIALASGEGLVANHDVQVTRDSAASAADVIPHNENHGTECRMSDFSLTDEGIEGLTVDNVIPEDEMPDIAQASGDGIEADYVVGVTPDSTAPLHPSTVGVSPQSDEISTYTFNDRENETDLYFNESQHLEFPLNCTTDLVEEKLDSQNNETDDLPFENYLEVNSIYRDHRKGKSLSLDDVTDSVANDFLNMLGIEDSPFGFSSESEPDSPRERLLRQFEKDTLANGGLLNFDFDTQSAEHVFWETTSEDVHYSSTSESFEEKSHTETDAFNQKTSASRLEDLETEALMHEWGFNERAFQRSPRGYVGFGSPIDATPEDPQPPPSLAEGLGPFVQTKDGGFLRSMNPEIFRNAKSGGSLIMQVSNPVVVPAEMGSSVMDILQGLASVGIEKLSMQAKKLMPLEDVTGKTMQQIAWEGIPSLDGPERQDLLHQESETRQSIHSEQKSVKGISHVPRASKSNSSSLRSEAEYVSLEDLAPLAMDKIEALSIEGLRIQSGMSDEDAPSNIIAQSIGEFSALKGKTVDVGGSIGLDGTCGLQLMDVKANGEDVDGLMGLSLTLDEWMKLDSGDIDEDDLANERTSKILAAHHATSLDQFRGRSKGEKRRGRSRKYGLLGNNFTVALMVQLRDPLRNYEPVGTPMLALIQVERVFVPPKPKIYATVCAVGNSDKDDNGEVTISATTKDNIAEEPKEEIHQEEVIPQFKIAEVHVAGLKAEQSKKKLWGSANQQQSGSRWLLANGMGKKNKHPLVKSGAVSKSSAPMKTGRPGGAFWSIS